MHTSTRQPRLRAQTENIKRYHQKKMKEYFLDREKKDMQQVETSVDMKDEKKEWRTRQIKLLKLDGKRGFVNITITLDHAVADHEDDEDEDMNDNENMMMTIIMMMMMMMVMMMVVMMMTVTMIVMLTINNQ